MSERLLRLERGDGPREIRAALDELLSYPDCTTSGLDDWIDMVTVGSSDRVVGRFRSCTPPHFDIRIDAPEGRPTAHALRILRHVNRRADHRVGRPVIRVVL